MYKKGFTVVEILVVIAILGILVSLVTFSVRGWQSNVAQKQVKSDLALVATSMQNQKNFGSGYPTSIPSDFRGSSDVTLTYMGGNDLNFCIEARSTRVTSVVFNIKAGADAISGTCDPAYALSTPSPSTSATHNTVTVSWTAISGASSYVVKYGTTSANVQASCSTSPCVINNLAASTQYKVMLTASSTYDSKNSSVVNVSTTAAPLRCDTGDTKSGNTCTNTYTASYRSGTSAYYTCPNGGTLSGTNCTSSTTYPATYADGGLDYCNPPDVGYQPGVCQTPSGSLVSSESQGYYCPNGGTVSGTTCYKTTSYPATYNPGTAAGYYCPSGGTLSGTTCTRTYPAY